MQPVIKYVGGKKKEIPYFEKWIPKKFNRYIEPFFGGGAVFFHLEPEKAIINDCNEKLMNFYRTLAYNREQLIKELKTMKNEEEFYYKMRDAFNGKISTNYSDASIYAYLNRTAFSGMIRYNTSGEFNVPFGRYKTFHPWKFFTEEASNLLKKAEIYNRDFEEILAMAEKDDFVFLDPPYDSVFSDYNAGGFSTNDHVRLKNAFEQLPCKALMVISDRGIIRELYAPYIKEEFDKTYVINIRNRMIDNNNVKHLIIANYDM